MSYKKSSVYENKSIQFNLVKETEEYIYESVLMGYR